MFSDVQKVNDAPRNWVTTSIFGLTFIAALTLVPLYGFFNPYDAVEWAVAITFLFLCGFSITAGYHRLWSHKTYEAHWSVRAFWAFWGACSLQNTILMWSSGHRRHHRYVDDNEKDPYSIGRGFWFAHIGWMLRNYPSGTTDTSNVKDLERDPIVRFQHKHYAILVILSNIVLPIALGALNGDIIGMFLLAGVLRLVVSHHVTFFINSLCHMWGKRPYTDENTARDNGWLALVTYGEGYHNFHHIFQSDYRNGVRWWQYDPTKWLIFGMSKVGLATNLRRTPQFKIHEAVLNMQFKRARARLETRDLAEQDTWRTLLEVEYQQFSQALAEWKAVRMEWVQEKRQSLAEKTQELQSRIQESQARSRLLELEYGLKLQRKRIQQLMGNGSQLPS